MRTMRWIIPIAILVILAGCSSGSSDYTSVNSAQLTIKDGLAETLTLDSGASVTFPANCFDSDTVIMFADVMETKDNDYSYFPTGVEDTDNLAAGIVVNTPADKIIQRNINVTFAFNRAVTPAVGEQYAIYRFDYEDDDNDSTTSSRWNRWGNRYATVQTTTSDAGYMLATATLPTFEMVGYIGSLAIFANQTVPSPVAEVDANDSTWLEGYVVDSNNNGIATDIALYVVVGSKKYAADVLNNDAYIPTLPDADSNYVFNGWENTIQSDGDGYFKFYLPENLIGQFVGLEFGHESAAWSDEESFYLINPAVTINGLEDVPNVIGNDSYLLLEDTKNMVVRFGMNKVVTYPLSATS